MAFARRFILDGGFNDVAHVVAPTAAGALSALGAAAFADALLGAPSAPPLAYWAPGLTAAIAAIMLQFVPRFALAHGLDNAFDSDGGPARARAWLLIAYVLVLASAAHGVSLAARAPPELGRAAGAALAEAACFLAAGLAAWAWRAPDGGGVCGYTAY